MNIYEGEIIKNHLKINNLNNVTVINSCAVTEEAEKKVSYEIRKAKKNFPKNKIIIEKNKTKELTSSSVNIKNVSDKLCRLVKIYK